MKKFLTKTICCPNCNGELALENEKAEGEEIVEGNLRCLGCDNSYNIADGVPRMALNLEELRQVSDRYGYFWAKRAENKFERNTLYGLSEEEEFNYFLSSFNIQPADLKGKRILDAGCGCGRLTRMLGSYADEVFGIDISSSINDVYDYCKSQENVHIIQSDLLKLPFREGSFDYVWSSASICFANKSEETFKHISSLVKPSGKLYVRVFSATKLSLVEKMGKVFRGSHKLPMPLLFYVSYPLAIPLSLLKFMFKKSHNLRENAFHVFEELAHSFNQHTEEEVRGWFLNENYSLIKSLDDSGVAVSGIKK